MTTEIQARRIEEALGADLVVQATAFATRDLATYDPERMSDGDQASLIDRLRVVQLASRRLSDEQASLLRPLADVEALIRAKFRPTLIRLAEALVAGKRILELRKRRLLEEARRAKEEADRRAQAAAAAEASRQDGPQRPAMVHSVVAPANVQQGSFGQAVGRKDVRFEITDALLLLRAYPHLVDVRLNVAAAKLQLKALRASDPAAEIPGLRVIEVEATTIR
jgi:hypothetical protein